MATITPQPDEVGRPVRVDVPTAPDDTRCAVACALSRWGAQLLAARFDLGDIHSATMRSIARAAIDCPLVRLDERFAWIAEHAGVERDLLVWLDALPRLSLVDERGVYARRVREAAERRRELVAHLDAIERLAS